MRKLSWSLLPLMLLAGGTVRAGGFGIYESGASATGMADARTASSDEISALYYNPAAIVELPGFQIQLGTTFILPSIHYDPKGGAATRKYVSRDASENPILVDVNDGQNATDVETKFFTPVHVHVAYNFESLGLSIGYALFNPFGLGTYYPSDWDGRFIGVQTELATFFNQPTVAVDLAKLFGFKETLKLSFAAGYNFVYATAKLGKGIDMRGTEALGYKYLGAEGAMYMEGSAFGHGYNFALFAEIPEVLAFGASVRSGVPLNFSGDANFTFNAAGEVARDDLALAGKVFPTSTPGKVSIKMPWMANFGVAYLGIPNVKIAADVYLGFFQSYDELDLKLDCVNPGPNQCTALVGKLKPIRKNWGMANQFSLGGEFRVPDWNSTFRAGYGLVTSGAPKDTYDPGLPDGLRNLFSVGYGYRFTRGDAIDVSYMFAFWNGEKDNLVGKGEWDGTSAEMQPTQNPEGLANGTYTSMSHLLAVTVSVHF